MLTDTERLEQLGRDAKITATARETDLSRAGWFRVAQDHACELLALLAHVQAVEQSADSAVDAYRAEVEAMTAERDALARQLDDVHRALAEANVPRSDGLDEPLYSEAYRVRLLSEGRDALARAVRLVEIMTVDPPSKGATQSAVQAICDVVQEALAAASPPEESKP